LCYFEVLLVRTAKRSEHARGLGACPPMKILNFLKANPSFWAYLKKVELAKKEHFFYSYFPESFIKAIYYNPWSVCSSCLLNEIFSMCIWFNELLIERSNFITRIRCSSIKVCNAFKYIEYGVTIFHTWDSLTAPRDKFVP
jgi:hypothetical protein